MASLLIPPKERQQQKRTRLFRRRHHHQRTTTTRDSWVQTDAALAPLASEEEYCSDVEEKREEEVRMLNAVADLRQGPLQSQMAVMPGSRDKFQRSIVHVSLKKVHNACDLAEILLYFQTIPRRETMCLGFLLLVDGRRASASDWDTLGQALSLVEGCQPGTVSLVLCLSDSCSSPPPSSMSSSHIKFDSILNENQLLSFISRDQLPAEYGGSFPYDHREWIQMRQFLDPFAASCHRMGCRLMELIRDLREGFSSSPTTLVEQQRRQIQDVLSDPRLRSLLEERASDFFGQLEERWERKYGHNPDYEEAVLKSRLLHGQLKSVVQKLEGLANKRLNRLQECLMARMFEKESSQILRWLSEVGEETLADHETSLATAEEETFREKEQEFEKFYFLAMRQIERGNDLLEEGEGERRPPKRASSNLKRHLDDFTERLEEARERLEDTSRCYQLLDRSYEWCLETMRFVSSHLESAGYLRDHPRLKDDLFEEMARLAGKLDNPVLLQQCEVSRAKYEETIELVETRQRILSLAEEEEPVIRHRPPDDDMERLADAIREQNRLMEGGRTPLFQNHEKKNLPPRCSSCSDFEDLLLLSSKSAENFMNSRTLMMIVKEMIQTERDYVRSLAYIIENYVPVLQYKCDDLSLRCQRNVIFGNIEKIYEFHNCYFLRELEQCEGAPHTIGDCFLKHESQFYLYALYNKNKPKSDILMAEYGNDIFKAKQRELDDKMDLASYLLKPVQRMGKYALLLKQLLKECPLLMDTEHYNSLKSAEEMIRFQLRHGNDLLAMDALRDCDVNMKEQGRLLRQDEFLVGRGRSRKSLRRVFLFEELILFSKAVTHHPSSDIPPPTSSYYQYKSSMKTCDVGLTAQVGESPTQFEIWFRKCKLQDTLSLQAPSPDIKNAWVEEITGLLWKQAERNRNLRMEEMCSMGVGNKPSLDIRPSQNQIFDRSISLQQLGGHKVPHFRHSAVIISDNLNNNDDDDEVEGRGFCVDNSPPPPCFGTKRQSSQCSAESGVFTDLSTSGESYAENVDRMKMVSSSSSYKEISSLCRLEV